MGPMGERVVSPHAGPASRIGGATRQPREGTVCPETCRLSNAKQLAYIAMPLPGDAGSLHHLLLTRSSFSAAFVGALAQSAFYLWIFFSLYLRGKSARVSPAKPPPPK
jgi:hypothetical protein